MQGLEPLTHSYMLQLQFPVVLQGTGGVYFGEMAYRHARMEAAALLEMRAPANSVHSLDNPVNHIDVAGRGALRQARHRHNRA